jgi:hypothetical protein
MQSAGQTDHMGVASKITLRTWNDTHGEQTPYSGHGCGGGSSSSSSSSSMIIAELVSESPFSSKYTA